jgi:2-oxoglutarate dehydrogenase E1 component
MFASRLLVARRSSYAHAGARLRTPLVPARRFVATPMRRAAEPPHPSEAFLQGNAANYVEEMYAAWKADTASVHKSWDVYFRNVDRGAAPGAAFVPPPTLGASGASLVPASASASSAPAGEFRKPSNQDILDHLKVQLLVRAYQVRGHHLANLDPLGILDPDLATEHPPELDLSFYGLSEADLDRSFFLGQGVLPKFVNQQTYSLTLREIIEKLKMVYCAFFSFLFFLCVVVLFPLGFFTDGLAEFFCRFLLVCSFPSVSPFFLSRWQHRI